MRKRAPKKSVKSRKAIKIQKNGTFICECHFFCVILQRKMQLTKTTERHEKVHTYDSSYGRDGSVGAK